MDTWARVQRDGGGDLMRAAKASKPQRRQLRDNTFIKYDVLVDIHAHRRNCRPEFESRSLYDQLQYILVCPLPAHRKLTYPNEQPQAQTLLLAAVRQCNTTVDAKTSIPHYTDPLAALEVIDLASIQAVVGRIWNRKCWAILDRSGELARAQYVVGGSEGDME
ncbi:hypothetical protein M422DRAFT_180592 [Sphaerobolus stellatus SS14]|uniref:Unplaced genomic scaffold SPHSTscaffold_112, whole genome shotgun sequence n=1 Tax=Sphaerobolus stellatus (strain SS14) TaxID=990650 RepID=A0A0C9TYN7_SPHS4|nr:hypothetical protein M422DRAFT_180592 [Sphaerobolus stellatus SS14]